ncbi:MAG TPA: Sec-independent protein translocase protein TatB [Pseudolabrys sp.]|jgi:sec-independent protein translocase protein TatB
MFDIGWGELVVIGIVALIAIGPKELPTVLRSLAQWMGKIRRMAAEFQGQFQEALREAEVADLKKHADDLRSSVTDFTNFDPMANTQKEMERAFMPEAAKTGELGAEPSAEAANATPPPSPEPATPLPEVTPLPEINVPLPELPAPIMNADFAPTEVPPPKPAPKQAGGST